MSNKFKSVLFLGMFFVGVSSFKMLFTNGVTANIGYYLAKNAGPIVQNGSVSAWGAVGGYGGYAVGTWAAAKADAAVGSVGGVVGLFAGAFI